MADTASTKPKKPSARPKYSEMETQAINILKKRGGSSRQAVLKYVMANFNVGKDAKSVNAHLDLALGAGVKNKSLKQSKGTGASGSFKVGEVKAAKKPTKAKKAAKPKAVKPKKSVAKKGAVENNAQKPSTKKATAKPKKAKSSTKTSDKPKAKKAPKKKSTSN